MTGRKKKSNFRKIWYSPPLINNSNNNNNVFNRIVYVVDKRHQRYEECDKYLSQHLSSNQVCHHYSAKLHYWADWIVVGQQI